MDIKWVELQGSWIQAAGTVIDAVGNTPSFDLSESSQQNFAVIGHPMQATGNALLADSMKYVNLDKIGNTVQSIGNLTIVTGVLLRVPLRIETELLIKGNLIQALGNLLSFFGISESVDLSHKYKLLLGVASLLQAIGNSLQALSGSIIFKGERAVDINAIGSWIQASGAVLHAVVQVK